MCEYFILYLQFFSIVLFFLFISSFFSDFLLCFASFLFAWFLPSFSWHNGILKWPTMALPQSNFLVGGWRKIQWLQEISSHTDSLIGPLGEPLSHRLIQRTSNIDRNAEWFYQIRWRWIDLIRFDSIRFDVRFVQIYLMQFHKCDRQ